MTREVANELWIAREILSKRGGDRRSADFNSANETLKTWSSYCAEIGISYKTADRWLNQLPSITSSCISFGKLASNWASEDSFHEIPRSFNEGSTSSLWVGVEIFLYGCPPFALSVAFSSSPILCLSCIGGREYKHYRFR
jgi:hypothetical protein